MATEVQAELVASLRAQLVDLDRRLGSARSEVERAQAEVDLLAGQYAELHTLIRKLEEPAS